MPKEPLRDSLILKLSVAKRFEAEGEFYDARCGLLAFNSTVFQPGNSKMGRDIDNAVAFLLEDIAKSLKAKDITFAQLSLAGIIPPEPPPPEEQIPVQPKAEEPPAPPKEKDAMDLAFEEAKAYANRSINRD